MVHISMLVSHFIFYCVFSVLDSHADKKPVIDQIGVSRTTESVNQESTLPTIEDDNLTESDANFTRPIDPCIAQNCSSENGPDVVYCPEKNENDTVLGYLEFPKTPATVDGTSVKIACPSGFLDDGMQPIFETMGTDFPSTAMREASSGVFRICQLTQSVFGEEGNIGQWVPPPNSGGAQYSAIDCRMKGADMLGEVFAKMVTTVNEYNYKSLLPQMQRILDNAYNDYTLATSLIGNIASVLEGQPMPPYLFQLFLNMLDDYARSVSLKPGYRVRINTSTLSLEAALFQEDTEEIETNSYYSPNYANSSLSINLPLEMIKVASDQNVSARLQITAYSSKVFSQWNGEESLLSNETDDISPRSEKEFTGQYRIILAKFVGAQIENLTNPFIYKLSVDTTGASNWSCVYWNETDEKWISDGINTVVLNEYEIQCESSHLTAFSAILNPVPFPGSDISPITAEHNRILGTLSSLGSALSIAGLFMTVLTYGLFRCLRKDRSNRVLFHLCLSLLLLHLMSVTSDRYLWNDKCFVPSYLLHYLLLTSLCWMLVEALHMFQLLISVFVKPEAHFLLKRAAFAWGFPLIIVSICAGVDSDVYYKGRDNLCIIAASLNPALYYTAYLGPAVLILAINCFVFCRITSVLYRQGVSSRNQRLMTSTLNQTGLMDWKQIKKTRTVVISPTQIKGALTVMILVGVGWVLALFAIGPFQLFFTYLFVICNAGQGVFIFVFRVLLHPLASRTWMKVLFGIQSDQGSSTSSSLRLNNKRQSMQSFSVSPTFISASSSAENTLTSSDPMSAKLASNLASMLRESEKSNSNLSKV